MLKIDNFKTQLSLGVILCFVMVACGGEIDDEDANNQKMLLPPPTQLRWSHDGEWIVYIEKFQSIQMINTNTKETKLLTGTGAYNHPVWSPDGTKIAYDHSPEDLGDIWVKTVRPSPDVSIKLTSAPQSDLCPEWSPDGKTIAFQSHRKGNWDIYVISSDGSSESVQLTSDPSSDQIPLWSPDGKEIVFRSNRTGDYEIWIISIDDMKLRQITNAEGKETNYRWSPDGAQIAYKAQRSEEYNIWVTETEGSGIETQISLNGDVGTLDWSPDGRYILYQSGDYVYCRNSDGTSEAILVAEAFEPLWSPDGERITFVRLDRENNRFVIEIEQTPEGLE